MQHLSPFYGFEVAVSLLIANPMPYLLCHRAITLHLLIVNQVTPVTCRVTRLQSLSSMIGPFICSGSHVVQKDCHPSALSTFVDAVFQCGPPAIPLKPCIIKYVGKSHNLWHRALLVLEQSAAETSPLFRPRSVVPAAATAAAEYDFEVASISPPVCLNFLTFNFSFGVDYVQR